MQRGAHCAQLAPAACAQTTARLVRHMLGVHPSWLHALPMAQPTVVQGVEVVLVDANHCPGAVQFLFRLPDGRKYVHTGDMRFFPAMLEDPHLQAFRRAGLGGRAGSSGQ